MAQQMAQHGERPQSNRRAQKWQTAAMTTAPLKRAAATQTAAKKTAAPKALAARAPANRVLVKKVTGKPAPAAPALARWHVYMVRCADDTLYTGIALDVPKRVAEHNGSGRPGARYTRARRPVALVYQERAADRSAAAKREYAIKQLSRSAKLALLRKSKRAAKA